MNFARGWKEKQSEATMATMYVWAPNSWATVVAWNIARKITEGREPLLLGMRELVILDREDEAGEAERFDFGF